MLGKSIRTPPNQRKLAHMEIRPKSFNQYSFKDLRTIKTGAGYDLNAHGAPRRLDRVRSRHHGFNKAKRNKEESEAGGGSRESWR